MLNTRNLTLSLTHWLQILAILLTILLNGIANSVLQLSLPNISLSLNVSYVSLSLVSIAYWLSLSIFALPFGKLGDIYTTKRVFLIGLCLFSFASLWMSIASSPITLVFSRLMQGVAMAAITPNAIALMRTAFPEEKRNQAMGLLSATLSLGYIIGPSLGGFLIELFDWRNVLIVIGLLVFCNLLLAFWILPLNDPGKEKFNVLTFIPFTLAFGTLMIWLNPIYDEGWTTRQQLGMVFIILSTGLLFVVKEKHSLNPIFDYQLLQTPRFFRGIIVAITYQMTIQGLIYLLPYYLQQVFNYKLTTIGILWAIMSLTTLLFNFLAVSLSNHKTNHKQKLIVVGAWLRFLSLALFAILPYWFNLFQKDIIVILLISLVIFGAGIGLTIAPLMSLVLGASSREKSGIASGTYITFRNLGGIFGIVLLSKVLLIQSQSYARIPPIFLAPFLVAAFVTILGILPILTSRQLETEIVINNG